MRGQRLDLIAVARGPQQIHGAVADRAGGTQDGHGAYGRCRGLVVTQRNCAHAFHQTIRPRPTPSTPPRKSPKIDATTTAATNPSRRSSNPPCPGMIWLESLTPKRRFTADSNRSPNWEAIERTAPSSSNGPVLPRPSAANPAAMARLAAKPPTAPAQVFLGLTRGQSFGPPMPRPAK